MKRFFAFLLVLLMLFSACAAEQSAEGSTDNSSEAGVPSQNEAEQLPIEPSEPEQPEEQEEITEPEFDVCAIMENMSTEEKAGQLFLARCPDSDALSDVYEYHLGGYILFSRDFKDSTPEEVAERITEYQSAAKIPMLIAVDEEGGTVTRVSRYTQFRQQGGFASPRYYYNKGGMDLVIEKENEKCALLQSLGINVNMAPVCDITTDKSAFMYERSLGQSPEETGRFAVAVTSVMAEYGIGGVLKHFPGYGNNRDTHTGIAIDNRSLSELESADLVPFRMAIESGCSAILISHTFVNCLDTEYPASLSEKVHDYLRSEMGFDGVAVTDDLVMEAITDLYGAEEAAVLAVLAGNDLLCSSEYKIQYAAVLNAVESGRISMELLDEAVARVLIWKYNIGLIN